MDRHAIAQPANFLIENQATFPLSLEEMMRLQQRAMKSSADGIVILEASSTSNPIFYINPAFERITGYSMAEVIGQDYQTLLSKDQTQSELANLRHILQAGKEAQVVLLSYRKDGSEFWSELHVAPVSDEAGTICHYVGIITDITQRKVLEEQLIKQATHDPLTKLPNRLLLLDRVSQALSYTNAQLGEQIAVLFIDLDHFKKVNDNLGHAQGDILLKIAATRLIDCVRNTDTVARLGGDEFVVLLTSIYAEQDVVNLTQRLLRALATPYVIEQQQVLLSASIGISLFPKDGTDTETLLKKADSALYRAKETGRNQFHFFTDELNQLILQRSSLEQELRAALIKQELLLHYQPLVDLESNRIIGFEALLRWQHPVRGLVPPLQFINIAEESGLIIPIGEWLIETACQQLSAWHAQGFNNLIMSVNVSRQQIKQVNLVERIAAILAKTGVAPHYLMFELAEPLIVENLKATTQRLAQLKALGATLVIDDFGTGNSNINYLKYLAVDKIKLNKTFINDVATDPASAAIAKAMIAMAKALQLTILAEGIETAEQLQFLRAAGCDEMQGFYFSQPVAADLGKDMLIENKVLR